MEKSSGLEIGNWKLERDKEPTADKGGLPRMEKWPQETQIGTKTDNVTLTSPTKPLQTLVGDVVTLYLLFINIIYRCIKQGVGGETRALRELRETFENITSHVTTSQETVLEGAESGSVAGRVLYKKSARSALRADATLTGAGKRSVRGADDAFSAAGAGSALRADATLIGAD